METLSALGKSRMEKSNYSLNPLGQLTRISGLSYGMDTRRSRGDDYMEYNTDQISAAIVRIPIGR